MALYKDIYDMEKSVDLRKQVEIACRYTARDILAEDPAASKHTERAAWARSISGMPQPSLIDWMVRRMPENATMAALAPNGPWADSDVQFVVNSNINLAIGQP